jgi:hypothetical protein
MVADLGLEVVDEAVAVVGLPGPEPGLHGRDGLVTPIGEPAWRDAELPAEGVEGLAAQDAQDDLGLTSAGPASPVLAAGRSCGRASPSLRIDRPDAVLLRHGRHCPHVSQMGVSGDRAPTQDQDVQLLLCQQSLQTGVVPLKLLHPAHRIPTRLPVLGTPAVQRYLGHPERRRHLGDRRALSQGLVSLPQLRDHLLGTAPRLVRTLKSETPLGPFGRASLS